MVGSEDFVEAVSVRIAEGPDDGRAALRFEYARENSCRKIVERLLDWIDEA